MESQCRPGEAPKKKEESQVLIIQSAREGHPDASVGCCYFHSTYVSAAVFNVAIYLQARKSCCGE